MLFREFSIIAAAAYAAQARAELESQSLTSPDWDELAETERMQHAERVMAVARGDAEGGEPIEDNVFGAVARAVLGYNGGQGGLALERIAHLGSAMVTLELVTEEQAAAGGDIVDHAVTLLATLAEVRGEAVDLAMTLGILPELPEPVADDVELEPTVQ